MVKASTESVFALAADLNKKDKKKEGEDSDGLYSSKSDILSEEEEEVVIKKGKGKKGDKKNIRK